MAREYPTQPVVGVGAVLVRGDLVLLVKRGHEPRKGEWSLPGGLVDLGESLEDAVRREVKEETGLEVAVGPMVETFDRVHRDEQARIRYHFVIIDYLCLAPDGEPRAGSDAEAVTWASDGDLEGLLVNPHAAAVIRKGLAMAALG